MGRDLLHALKSGEARVGVVGLGYVGLPLSRAFCEAGFRVLGHYWTQGQYDLVVTVEAPSEEAMLAGLFAVAEAGNVVSETLRAFTDEEMQRALGP